MVHSKAKIQMKSSKRTVCSIGSGNVYTCLVRYISYGLCKLCMLALWEQLPGFHYITQRWLLTQGGLNKHGWIQLFEILLLYVSVCIRIIEVMMTKLEKILNASRFKFMWTLFNIIKYVINSHRNVEEETLFNIMQNRYKE